MSTNKDNLNAKLFTVKVVSHKCLKDAFKAREKSIDFKYGCKFNKDTGCKTVQKKQWSENPNYFPSFISKERGCCTQCAAHLGYLFYHQVTKAQKATYKRLFDEEDGFWRADGGCCLPRKFRSTTCLEFHCNNRRPFTLAWCDQIRVIKVLS